MKKILFTFIAILVTAAACFALTTPRWDKRPIKVYIPNVMSEKGQMMKEAFEEWQTKTYSAVWFIFLGDNKKNEADIDVHFVDIVTDCNSPAAVGCTRSQTDLRGFYTYNIVEIGSRYRLKIKGDDGTVITQTHVVTPQEMYGIMLHEIGHAIGIVEHSDNVNSVMFRYSMYDYKIPQHLTPEDLRLVYKTYR